MAESRTAEKGLPIRGRNKNGKEITFHNSKNANRKKDKKAVALVACVFCLMYQW